LIPLLETQQQGVTSLSADYLNTLVAGGAYLADLRGYPGLFRQTVYMIGYTAVGDGGEGNFVWNATSITADDGGVTTIAANGVPIGRWQRMYTSSQPNVVTNATGAVSGNLASFNGTTGDVIEDSGIAVSTITTLESTVASLAGSIAAIPVVANYSALANATSGTLPASICYVLGYRATNDGAQGIFTVGATLGSANGGTTINDASARTWYRNSSTSTINVKWFGAYGDNSHDDTAEIQAAINASEALSSPGQVLLPASQYLVTGSLTVNTGGISLIGEGRFSTIINFTNTTQNCLTVGGSTYGGSIYGFAMRDMWLKCTSKTGGTLCLLQYVNQVVVSNVYITMPWIGFTVWGTNEVFMEKVTIQGMAGGTNCWGLKYYANPSAGERSDYLTTNDFTVYAGYSGANGFVWDGAANTWNGNNMTALNCAYGMYIVNTAQSTTAYPTFGEFNNFNTDGMSVCGLSIGAGSDFQFSNSQITNTSGSSGQGSADNQALRIVPDVSYSKTRQIQFANCRIGLARIGAAYVEAIGVQFTNTVFASGATTTSNTYNGLEIGCSVANSCYNISVQNCTDYEYGNPNNFQYGIRIDSGVVDYVVANNILSIGAVTGAVSDAGGSVTKYVANNI